MTDINTELEQVPEVLTTEPIVPKEVIKFKYQPVDDLNRPLGAEQVFEGETWTEIAEKIAKANKELIKLNRDLNKKIRLGEVQTEDIPENITRNSTDGFDYSTKPLSPEEKVQISRDLLDPDKFEEASKRLMESMYGDPDKLRQSIAQTQQEIASLRANEEAKAFVNANKDYYVCPENFETVTSWMVKNDLAPVRHNFQYAYDTLKAVGLLLEAPIVREEHPVPAPEAQDVTLENSHPATEPTSRITSEEPSQTKRLPRVASGLNRNIASDVGPVIQSNKLTVEQIEKMDSATYKKRLLTDPTFAKAVDEVYAKSNSQSR